MARKEIINFKFCYIRLLVLENLSLVNKIVMTEMMSSEKYVDDLTVFQANGCH